MSVCADLSYEIEGRSDFARHWIVTNLLRTFGERWTTKRGQRNFCSDFHCDGTFFQQGFPCNKDVAKSLS